jgi:DNA-binding NarL/FixJ family response regulator
VVVVPRRGAEAAGPVEPEAGQGPAVLLIDRQPLFLAALGSILSSPPVLARIQIASSTDVGLELAEAGHVQLVFCEVKAEPIPPVELAQRLSELTPRVPLILLGEPDDERLMSAALHTSVAGMFTKDAALDEFLAGVKAVLSGHRAVGSNLMSRVIARLTDSAMPVRRTASQLSPTELDILAMIGQARSIPFIAERRGISHKTVRNHLANIYRKLELRTRTEAMLCAARMGLTGD